MGLETITGNLLAYQKLEPGTSQHSDQITTERRTNHRLRDEWFYPADGQLYTVQKEGNLWAITREPQNLVLQNLNEAFHQLTSLGNYFPDAEEAKSSFEHPDTVIVDVDGLELEEGDGAFCEFIIDSGDIWELNSQQRLVAQRIYGPDEDNFEHNMEMFDKAGISPTVLVLMPDYVQASLCENGKEYLGQASWLGHFYDDSSFGAFSRVGNCGCLRGERKIGAGYAEKK